MFEKNRIDEVNLIEMFSTLRRYRWLLLILPLVGAILANLLVPYILHPTWEASAVLELGSVARVNESEHVVDPHVEPITKAVTRVMLPSFAKDALNAADTSTENKNLLLVYYGTMVAEQVANTDFFRIKLRGPSAELARSLINGAIVNLQKVHNEIEAAQIKQYSEQLKFINENIQKARAESERITKWQYANFNLNAMGSILSVASKKEVFGEFRLLNQDKLVLERLLDSSQTYNTRLVGEVLVSGGGVSPNKNLIVGMVIMLALIVAIMLAFSHNAIVKGNSP